jgi:hypothetical protein
MALQMGGILRFEFLNYLSNNYKNECDLLFYIDIHQCWYHKGIVDLTNNIDETVIYLNNKIINGNYNKVIFMGVSAGGYAAILFGSLCSNVTNIISYIPQTILKNAINKKYSNLKNIINQDRNYILYGDLNIIDKNNNHHILHCNNLKKYTNVKIIEKNGIDLKQLRDCGEIKSILDSIIY